jgi:hypothetical protein
MYVCIVSLIRHSIHPIRNVDALACFVVPKQLKKDQVVWWSERQSRQTTGRASKSQLRGTANKQVGGSPNRKQRLVGRDNETWDTTRNLSLDASRNKRDAEIYFRKYRAYQTRWDVGSLWISCRKPKLKQKAWYSRSAAWLLEAFL